MTFSFVAISLFISSGSVKSISFKRINVDSVVSISQNDKGGSEYATDAIIVKMKSGDRIQVLHDKEERFDPRSFITGLSNSWFSIGNPDGDRKKGNCLLLLCSLKLGACKCSEVVVDSGYMWLAFEDGAIPGGAFVDGRLDSLAEGEIQNIRPPRTITEKVMEKRFIRNLNTSTRIR